MAALRHPKRRKAQHASSKCKTTGCDRVAAKGDRLCNTCKIALETGRPVPVPKQ